MESRSTLLGWGLHVGGDDFDLACSHLATARDTGRLLRNGGLPCVLALIGHPHPQDYAGSHDNLP